MAVVVVETCPGCRRRRRHREPACALCGRPFDMPAAPAEPERRVVPVARLAALDAESGRLRLHRPPLRPGPVRRAAASAAESVLGERAAWVALGIGLATAPVLALTPLLSFMGWFLASLVHEIGHALAAWLLGCPAFPAISLAGHAVAIHQEQMPLLAVLVAAAIGAVLAHRLAGRARGLAAAAVALHLAVAFSPLRDAVFLVAGHAGELAFAGVFLWRCATGGFTHSAAERVLYGTLGWFLVGKNAVLAAGLLGSESARFAYSTNGSFGLENDLLRLALPLPVAAVALLLAALATPALALLAASRVRVDEP